jgi:hypothetical protein
MARKFSIVSFLPKYGSVATGIVYATIGLFAILSFMKIREGGADESSILAVLNNRAIGKAIIWIIMTGTVCYIAWRIFETVRDPYNYGRGMKGIFKRSGVALSTIADVLIVYSAVRVLLGVSDVQVNGQPKEEREMVSVLLENNMTWLVMAFGIIICVAALIQFIYGVTEGYTERIDLEKRKPFVRKSIHVIAWFGYFSRGVILGITGYFFFRAALQQNSDLVVNTDKAFDFIGDHIGHFYFILIASGTIAYGFFMIIQGFLYDPDGD